MRRRCRARPSRPSRKRRRRAAETLREKRPLFAAAVRICELQPAARNLRLASILIKPVQRVPRSFCLRGQSADKLRRRRGCDVEIPWRRAAATPRLRRGCGCDVDIPWRRVAATPPPRRGNLETVGRYLLLLRDIGKRAEAASHTDAAAAANRGAAALQHVLVNLDAEVENAMRRRRAADLATIRWERPALVGPTRAHVRDGPLFKVHRKGGGKKGATRHAYPRPSGPGFALPFTGDGAPQKRSNAVLVASKLASRKGTSSRTASC